MKPTIIENALEQYYDIANSLPYFESNRIIEAMNNLAFHSSESVVITHTTLNRPVVLIHRFKK